ncbi:MAG: helix-turn-helix transcriptional regulator [Dysgonamonadaceae bacterium]|jgi:DNA-binding HxlR family transcriptional regulator|nr:helix-turn-helix transcriptional regulator [Dysgonamonadaceae bacterium]
MKNFLHEGICPIRDVISRFGDKWSLLVFVSLKNNGTMRFNEIQKSIGDISQRMLTVTLRSLEADGYVNRTIYPEVPPRVEYCLSDLGRDLMPHLDSLIAWTLENKQKIMDSRKIGNSQNEQNKQM